MLANRRLATAALIALSLALAACPKKKPKKVAVDDATPTPTATATPAPTPDVDALMKGAGDATQADLTGSCVAQPVHFGLDSSTLDGSGDTELKAAADCLKLHPEWQVICEGHADERGSTQYNLALGERRARAVMKWLTDSGVDKARVNSTSYGEEKPVNPGHDERAWGQNRRVEFRFGIQR